MSLYNIDIKNIFEDVTSSYRYVINDICSFYNLEDSSKIRIYDNDYNETIYYNGKFIGYLSEVPNF